MSKRDRTFPEAVAAIGRMEREARRLYRFCIEENLLPELVTHPGFPQLRPYEFEQYLRNLLRWKENTEESLARKHDP